MTSAPLFIQGNVFAVCSGTIWAAFTSPWGNTIWVCSTSRRRCRRTTTPAHNWETAATDSVGHSNTPTSSTSTEVPGGAEVIQALFNCKKHDDPTTRAQNLLSIAAMANATGLVCYLNSRGSQHGPFGLNFSHLLWDAIRDPSDKGPHQTWPTSLGLQGLSSILPHVIQLTTRWLSADSSAPLFTFSWALLECPKRTDLDPMT